jgi:hypothetical protein
MTTTALMREMISGSRSSSARQIGKRAYGTNHDLAGKAFCGVNHVISGIERMLPAGGVRNVDAAKPVEAVHQVARLMGRNCCRPGFTLGHVGIRAPMVEQRQCVAGRFMGADIAENGCQRQQFQFRMGNRVGNGHGVVDSGIGVDDDPVRQLRFSP